MAPRVAVEIIVPMPVPLQLLPPQQRLQKHRHKHPPTRLQVHDHSLNSVHRTLCIASSPSILGHFPTGSCRLPSVNCPYEHELLTQFTPIYTPLQPCYSLSTAILQPFRSHSTTNYSHSAPIHLRPSTPLCSHSTAILHPSIPLDTPLQPFYSHSTPIYSHSTTILHPHTPLYSHSAAILPLFQSYSTPLYTTLHPFYACRADVHLTCFHVY